MSTPPDAHPAGSGSRFAFPLAVSLIFAVAAFESASAIAADDFGYLMWGLQSRDDALAWVRGPEWFSYRRPLNALLWWLSARSGIDGELVRWAQVGLWTTLCAALLWVTRHSSRAATTLVVLLLTNQVLIDLLQWRSWVTTTGSLAFLVLAALTMEGRMPAATVALLGFLALGFKEVGALAVAAMAFSRPGYRWVGAALTAGLAVSAASSTHKLGLTFVGDNLRFHAETVALFAPLVPVLVAARFPNLPAWTLLLCAGLVALPNAVVAVIVVLCTVLFLAREPRWLAAFVVAFSVPFAGSAHARQYLLESWTVVVLALVNASRFSVPMTAWCAMLLLAAPSAIDFEQARMKLRDEFMSQRAFLRAFQPPVARHLYHPDPNWSWDLDALYWVQGGASLEGPPPEGMEPVQLGPRSGVWADLRPTQGNGNKYTEPAPAPP